MKIAYIVLCHKNANQINILVDELIKNDADVFLHVDLKSNIVKDINKTKNLYILPKEKSYSVNWGGNNMILATLSLIEYVRNMNIKYDYICLLSGQDFPLVNHKIINDYLISNKGYNFIQVMDKGREYKKYVKFYDLWYPNWITKDKLYIKILKRLYMIITGGYSFTFKIFKRKKPFNGEFNIGSQWWTLTTECAYYMLDYCNKYPEYIKYFENSIVPDECFFQTLFMLSPYSEKRKDNLTYVNWKSNKRSPEILTMNDYDLLQQQSKTKCFARKFDIDVDNDIIISLQNKIKGDE